MKVKIESTRVIKPKNARNTIPPPSTSQYIPLSVFDKVTYDTHIAIIYAYRPPTPPNATIEYGLQRALSEYREWAGRLGKNEKGEDIILLNDEGVKLVDARVDGRLDEFMPILKPSPTLLTLHPSVNGVEELVQVQLTRFTCGSLVVGFTAHHLVADGHSTSNFLVAWGKACRAVDMGPLPLHDRTIFSPRDPPIFEFEHRGIEFKNKKEIKISTPQSILDKIVINKVHFSLDFLAKLKTRASQLSHYNTKPYSSFVCLVAHLWKTMTKARGLNGSEKTHVRISVNGRMKLDPRVSNDYFGNLVLWAFPSCRVKDLVSEPLLYAAKLINDAIANVDNNYLRSFIDFAHHKAKKEDLVATADMNEFVLCPNVNVHSWLRFPFYDLDCGGGSPHVFMPSYFPIEGEVILLPSFVGDGSIDAFVALFQHNFACFKQICYSID